MTVPTFPTLAGQSFPITRTATWDTVKQSSISGKRVRFPTRSVPQWIWEINFQFLRQGAISATTYADLATLAGFYNSCAGAAYAFAYADPVDNSASAQVFGTGDGATTQFQLCRSFGGFVEPVYLPTGTPALTNNGSAISTANYSIGATGIVTFASAPTAGASLAWSGGFNWLCRFEDDNVDFVNFMQGYSSLEKLRFSSEIYP